MTSPEAPYTTIELETQRAALVREIPAWLVANDPHNPSRRRTAVREIRRITKESYVADDLDDDVVWIMQNDLGRRLPIVALLDEGSRRELIELASNVAASGSEIGQSDAQFIELLGSGLRIDEEMVAAVVMTAVQAAALRAA